MCPMFVNITRVDRGKWSAYGGPFGMFSGQIVDGRGYGCELVVLVLHEMQVPS